MPYGGFLRILSIFITITSTLSRGTHPREKPRGIGLLQLPNGVTDERSGPFFPNLFMAGDKIGEKPASVPDTHLAGQKTRFSGRTAFNPFTHAVSVVYNEDLADSWGSGFAVHGVNGLNLNVRENFDEWADVPLLGGDGTHQPFISVLHVGAEYDFVKYREFAAHMDLPLPGVNELFDIDGHMTLKGNSNTLANGIVDFPLPTFNERAPYTIKYVNFMADRHMQFGHVMPNFSVLMRWRRISLRFLLLFALLTVAWSRAPYIRDRPRGLGLLQLPTGMTDERSGPFFPNLYMAGDKAGEKPISVPDAHLAGQKTEFSGRTAFNPFTHAVAAVYNEDLVDSWGTGYAVNAVNGLNLNVRENFDEWADLPLMRHEGNHQPFLSIFHVGAEYDLVKIREVAGHMDLPILGVNELFDIDGHFMQKGGGNGITNSAIEFPLTLSDPNERAPYTFKYLNYMADRHMQYGHVVPNVNPFLIGKDKIMQRLRQNRLNPTMVG